MEARSQLQKGELKETLGEPRFSWKKKKKKRINCLDKEEIMCLAF